MSASLLPNATTVRLDAETRRMLDDLAGRLGLRTSDVIRVAVRQLHQAGAVVLAPSRRRATR